MHLKGTAMRAIKKARKLIESDPSSAISKALSKLVLALETETDFSLKQLYDLNIDDFDLAMEVMKDWRLDRFYEGKAKVIDVALQASSLK
jgi:hypothetical protein